MTGWSWEAVDEMLLEQANALARYWEVHPPVHESVAAMAGLKPPPVAEPRAAGQARASTLTDEERLMVERWDRAVGVA